MESEELFYSRKNAFTTDTKNVAYDYAADYCKFIDAAKTERESVTYGIKMAKKAGFKPYKLGAKVKPGDKYYYDNRGKNLFVFSIGTESIENGIRISAAHIDSPRLDLKQCPVYEDNGMAFFKTHYYGGIRKYQWVATPLALHGVVVTKAGKKLDVVIGEDDKDPVFYVNDLLPHLAAEQNKKTLDVAITGEMLNLLVGTEPCGDGNDAIRLNVLKLLNEKYGITEEDFLSAELCAVPAAKARDIGLDRALIGAYGHDDRVCAYPALTSLIDSKDSKHTLMCILADKEEIGSEGITGMKCELMVDLIDCIASSFGVPSSVVRANSKCLSADVSAAYDPNFPEVFEKKNTSFINCGVVLCKYTGARGKSSTNDASAEFIGWLRAVMAKDNVVWQTGELGKVDAGGGGTVAKFIAEHNIETVDLGVPVISMHAPYEVIAKNDLYQAYLAFRAFCNY